MSARAAVVVENMVVVVACSTLVEEMPGVGHKTVLLVTGQIWCSMLQGRIPYIRCYKPRDMWQVVLTPLGRSRVDLEQHTVEEVEGKELKCILGEEVVAGAEEVVEVGEGVEEEEEGYE